MPQRILKPAWEGIKSPITLKSLLLFLAVGFIGYTIIRDEQQRQAAFERYKVLAQNSEESRVFLEGAKYNNEVTAQNLAHTRETLKFMVEIRDSTQDIAELLKLTREATAAEHKALFNVKPQQRVAEPRGRRQRSLQPCYELRPIEKKYGNSSVVVNTLIETKCP